MRIGLIDVDGHNFPNIPLMKISAWHKQNGDSVEWYDPMFSGHMDKVYMSKVFGFTPDYQYPIDADEIIKGGSGYCISLEHDTIPKPIFSERGGVLTVNKDYENRNGIWLPCMREVFDKSKDHDLPYEIEHIYPDYSIYYDRIPEVKETAYGFLTRGCPRGCFFCHVEAKEGRASRKVADLSEFWNGQKNIVLCDPNILACKQWKDLFQQLIDSKAMIDINQGLDIRLTTTEATEMLLQMNIKNIHFAWDKYEDINIVVPKFERFKEMTQIDYRKLTVYVLVNFNTTHEQDLERIYTLRDLGYSPYVMIYNKDDFVVKDKNGQPIRMKSLNILLTKYTMQQIEHFKKCWAMQRWVNNNMIFRSCDKFEDYR